jgi:hypothetical protein
MIYEKWVAKNNVKMSFTLQQMSIEANIKIIKII